MSISRFLLRNLPAKITSNRISNNTLTVHNNHTHHLFDETSRRDIYSLNSVIASYVRNGDFISAWNLFSHVHRTHSNLNPYTFTPIVGACSALPDSRRGQQVHGLMIKTGSDSSTITKTALIDMYSKYGQLGDSVFAFDEVGVKDVVTWNSMLSSFLRHGFPLRALGVFEDMRREKVEVSEFTLCSVLKACASLNAFRQGKQVHGLVILMGRDLVILNTALIDLYSNVGNIDEAMKVYQGLNSRKDDIMHNSLISGCVRNKKFDMAMSILSSMEPNLIAFTSALWACSENSNLWIGKQIHGVSIRQGFAFNTQLCNVLLDMYAKCGRILNARFVFNGIPEKDVVSWTSMIDAYGSHGHGPEALELFKEMGKGRNDIFPNSVTFLAVLSACGHSGLVEQGQECFVIVRDKYGLEPGPEHYACFIDILGRAGRIEEVWCMYHDMVKNGTKPTSEVWAALLNACRVNLDVTRGEFAARNLVELEPNKPANYVALSNFYAATGRWDYVDNSRAVMKNKGLVKEVGSSWVAVASSH